MELDKKIETIERLIDKRYFNLETNFVGVKFGFLRGIASACNDYEINKETKQELFKDYLWIKRWKGHHLGRMESLLNYIKTDYANDVEINNMEQELRKLSMTGGGRNYETIKKIE